MTPRPSAAGFTFIELILYVALISLISGGVLQFGLIAVQNSEKSHIQQSVSDSARYVSERIKYEIHSASDISSVTSSSITLATLTPSANPTVIDISGGVIRITQGTGSSEPLTPSGINAASLLFTDLSASDDTSKHIEYAFTLTESGSVGISAFKWSATATGSAELRNNENSKNDYAY